MAKDFKQSDRQYYVSKNRRFVFVPLSLHVSYGSLSMVCQLKDCDLSYIANGYFSFGYSIAQVPLSSNYIKYNVMKRVGKRKAVKKKLVKHYVKAI